MALTKAQVSLVTVAALGVAPGGYAAQLQAFNTQKEAAAFIATTGLLNEGTNAEFVNTVVKNLGLTKTDAAFASQKAAFFKALEDGASRSDAAVDFANGQLVADGKITNVEKAIASTSTSMDLNALKLEVTPAVNAQEVTFETTNKNANGDFSSFKGSDLKANLGKAQIEKGESIISSDFTFNLKDQANVFTAGISTVGEFTGAFLSPMLERAAATQSDSAIYVKLLDGFAVRDGFQSIERLATNGVGFTIDGELVIIADKPTDVDADGNSTGAIYKAKNYVELKDALTARIAELAATGEGAYAKLANFTVELGSTFTKTNQAGQKVSGTELVIKDGAGSVLEPKGFNTFGGIHPHTDLNSINELTNVAPAKNTQLISTNIDAENVGYGSQGATLNIAGQSASKKGVEQFKVTAEKDVWFTRLESRDLKDNQHLQEVLLETGSNGYFNVGTQNKGNSLVALVDQNFGVKGGGLVDVLRLDASAANSTAVNAFISDKVIARNFNLKDTDSNYKADDVQINYSLTGGNDVLQLAVASEVLAYADTQVSINAGGGNDLVHLKVVGNALNTTGADAGKVQADSTNTYGKGWLANQQLNNNIEINANGGNNVIWTEGSGNARINTGNGDDTIYADNSGRTGLTGEAKAKVESLGMGADVNALFVLNAENATIGNILSNTANPTDGKGNNAQVFNTFKNTVAVSFKGFETKYVEIESTDYKTNTQQINQAIKEAILTDATLNKLLTVKEFPGNVLVIESMIDGVQKLTDLKIDFVAPAKADTTATSTPALAKGQIALDSNDLTDAAKAYAKAGTLDTAITAVTVANLAGVTGTFKGIYDLDANGAAKQYATGDAGANPFAALPAVADGGTGAAVSYAAGTDAVSTITVNTAADGAETALTVGGLDIFTAYAAATPGTTTNDNAAAILAALNAAKTADDTQTMTFNAATVPLSAITFSAASPADNTVIMTVDADWITDYVTGGGTAPDTTGPVIAFTAGSAAATSATVIHSASTEETQTITFTGAPAAAGTITVGGVDVTLTGTEADAAAVAVKVAAALTAGTTVNGVELVTGATSALGVVTIEYPASAGNIGVTTLTQSGAATVVEGVKSSAHSDNVINAGSGNDVIVLGTGDNSNDTVVLTGTFGKTTIVNFDSTAVSATEAVNGGDLLDFRTYLDANIGDTTVGQVKLDATTGATVAANAIKVIDFTTIKAGTASATNVGGIAAAEKLGDVTAAQLSVELNSKFNASLEATKNVFLIHNNGATGNDGEYLVVTATSTKGAAAVGTGTGGDTFNEVTIVGTLDFGAAQSFAGNIVGFDGAIV